MAGHDRLLEDAIEENEQRATAHLNFEGTRDQYVGGIPDDIASRIPAETGSKTGAR